jgi:hypothetical protein
MNLKSMLQDGVDGSLSSRRVVTFLAFVLCAIAFIANLFWEKKVETYMFEGMIYLAMAGLGATVAEKFSAKSAPPQNPIQPTYYRPINRNIGTPLPRNYDEERML